MINKSDVKDLWHPIERQWIRQDGLLTDFGKKYYAAIAKDIKDKRKASGRFIARPAKKAVT